MKLKELALIGLGAIAILPKLKADSQLPLPPAVVSERGTVLFEKPAGTYTTTDKNVLDLQNSLARVRYELDRTRQALSRHPGEPQFLSELNQLLQKEARYISYLKNMTGVSVW